MAEVWIPPRLRSLVSGQSQVRVEGETIREVIQALDQQYPGVKDHLCAGNDLIPGMAVVVDGEVSELGILEQVNEDSEVHFVPAIAGGS